MKNAILLLISFTALFANASPEHPAFDCTILDDTRTEQFIDQHTSEQIALVGLACEDLSTSLFEIARQYSGIQFSSQTGAQAHTTIYSNAIKAATNGRVLHHAARLKEENK